MNRVNARVSNVATLLIVSMSLCVPALVQASRSDHVAIPHSKVAVASGAGINKATLACATDRYAHGVLGDGIEAGCLVLENEQGKQFLIELPVSRVFEDLEPRIADVDNDGSNDVVVVRSDNQYGAALVVYTLKGDEASELFATPTIGRANRWLAPIGVADFNADGQPDIAYVQTPHIGGILKVWSLLDGKFQQIAEKRGFSNHSIGSRRVSTAKIVDHNDDGVVDIALPDQRRKQTVWLSLNPAMSSAIENTGGAILEPAVIDQQAYDEAYFQ